ncbi:maleylacetoacetate isomerase [Exophiala xenobiotica]|uniref:Maleylacetoacetate isomerase n=1 Tax=Exophiala xenobiotica TaxID=348802 RepID=A0A0D2EQD7_9EURO|nr:maleylacetoacetate isomerase [Exophiala xenobiotica]KIW57888.1 maleylacetoacetate isomerase [Exophiala xenobiotica]
MAESYKYTLYTYFRSSCSARVRIAAHIKGIPVEYKYIHLVKGEQHAREYTVHNPSESVPTLIVTDTHTGKIVTKIRQSPAILEFLEETTPDLHKLLPPLDDPVGRAKVRELLDIIACDVQPVTNLRVLNFIKPLNVEAKDWQHHFMTLDCALAPAIDGALRFGVDVQGGFPHIWKVWENLQVVEAFKKGRWDNQEDTPQELRTKE